MANDQTTKTGEGEQPAPRKDLPPAALRALAEAEERRRLAALQPPASRPVEHHGQAGPEPTRYGDWEKGGIISDF